MLNFSDGSIGTVHYFANGHRSFPKERLEAFCSGRILQIDNFRRLRGYGWPGFKRLNLWRQDKGHSSEVNAFVAAIRDGGSSPISYVEIREVSEATIRIAEALRV